MGGKEEDGKWVKENGIFPMFGLVEMREDGRAFHVGPPKSVVPTEHP